MKYCARLDSSNVVKTIYVIEDDIGNTEENGSNFLRSLYNTSDVFKQTYRAGTQRKNFATIEGVYDSTRDAYIPKQPYASWTLDESTCQWVCPVTEPTDGKHYEWNETTQTWDEV